MSQRVGKGRPPKQCANPIFEKWIVEWKDEAEAKNSKMKYVYAKALKSLRKYPLQLSSGKECSILDGFGSHMCKMIENRMMKEDLIPMGQESNVALPIAALEENEENRPGKRRKANISGEKLKLKAKKRVTAPTQGDQGDSSCDIDLTEDDGLPSSQLSPLCEEPKQKGRKKQYVPAFRSGGYALLMALHKKENEPDYRGYMTRTELQREAQCFCDSSFDRPDPAKKNYYTAWNSMSALVSKDLVLKRGSPAQYFLTPDGRALAQKLASAEGTTQHFSSTQNSTDDDEPIHMHEPLLTNSNSDQENMSEVESVHHAVIASDVVLKPGSFEIVLYVDTCETTGRSKAQEVLNELQKNGVTVFVQKLSIGDFVWVCRETFGKSANRNRLTLTASKELILPYVVERKRADDLAHSIRDGRYHEQKHRLTQTKMNVIYLVESYGKGDWGLREGALGQAMSNTQIISDFIVHETNSIKDTCAYLTLMTRHIKTLYENKTLIGIHKASYRKDVQPPNHNERYLMVFNDFNDFAVKKTHWNTKEMFARHLLKMKGLSPDKAFAIVTKYPSLYHLMKAYSDCTTDAKKQLLLANLNFGASGKRIGPSISRKVFRFYCTTDWS